MATGMTKTRRRKRRSGDVRSNESERGKRERFLSDRPCRRRQLESRALGHGIAGAPVEEALGFPWRGTAVVNRRGRVKRGLAVGQTTQMSRTANGSISDDA